MVKKILHTRKHLSYSHKNWIQKEIHFFHINISYQFKIASATSIKIEKTMFLSDGINDKQEI